MTAHGWLTLVACAGELGLAVLIFLRGARSPLALPLALLSLDLFAWNFFALAYVVSGVASWRWLDVAVSPLATPLGVHFLLTFMGRRRQLRHFLWLTYALFGVVGGLCLLAFVSPAAREFAGSRAWALVHLALFLPTMSFVLGLLAVHLRRAGSLREQVRTRLLIAALAILVAFAVTELLVDLGVDVPRLGNVGALVATALLAVVVLRFDLFERQLSSALLVYAAAIGTFATLAYLAVFQLLRANLAVLAAAVITITLALIAASQRIFVFQSARRQRLEHLATLGRFSSQMAHDLKNPLAALKGAAQFLREEHARGQSWSDKGEFLDLLVEQVERIQTVIDSYQRLGRVEPALAPVELNELTRSVLGLQRFASTASVAVGTELQATSAPLNLDRDLVASALENLLRNAFEAMPDGGKVTVRTREAAGTPSAVELEVEDSGRGMDARTRERAFDDFFTTKATGSGLGLSFVRRVVEAHGGSAALTTHEAQGTLVRLRFPR